MNSSIIIHNLSSIKPALHLLEVPADGVGEDPDPALDVGEHGDDGGGEDEPLPGEGLRQHLEEGPLKGEKRFLHHPSIVRIA